MYWQSITVLNWKLWHAPWDATRLNQFKCENGFRKIRCISVSSLHEDRTITSHIISPLNWNTSPKTGDRWHFNSDMSRREREVLGFLPGGCLHFEKRCMTRRRDARCRPVDRKYVQISLSALTISQNEFGNIGKNSISCISVYYHSFKKGLLRVEKVDYRGIIVH